MGCEFSKGIGSRNSLNASEIKIFCKIWRFPAFSVQVAKRALGWRDGRHSMACRSARVLRRLDRHAIRRRHGTRRAGPGREVRFRPAHTPAEPQRPLQTVDPTGCHSRGARGRAVRAPQRAVRACPGIRSPRSRIRLRMGSARASAGTTGWNPDNLALIRTGHSRPGVAHPRPTHNTASSDAVSRMQNGTVPRAKRAGILPPVRRHPAAAP